MFIVERYLPAVRHGELAATVDHDRWAAERMTAAGVPVRHLSTIYVPSDESCFSLFDAPSADALRQAQERAGIGFERIVEAVQVPPHGPAWPVSTEPRGDLEPRPAAGDEKGVGT